MRKTDIITNGLETRDDLKRFLTADRLAMHMENKSVWKEWLKGNTDHVNLWLYVKRLREYELIYNQYNKKGGFFRGIKYLFSKHRFKRMQQKYGIFVSPNATGPGLEIVHYGYIWLDGNTRAGANLRILPRVLFGKNKPYEGDVNIRIGDNVTVCTGATILGPCKIGNNVTIGANAVVLHDIPNNAIVAGVPANIIRIKENRE